MKLNWTKVGKGIVYASIGAGLLGAVHYMFLANQITLPDIAGIPSGVILPFIIGALGFVASYSFPRLGDTGKDILQFGSAALIGFGIATYANWITPVAVTARARYVPTVVARAPISTMPTAAAVKMI